MSSQLTSIQFYNDVVPVYLKDNKPYLALRPIVQNIGLDWQSQLQKVRRNHILNKGVVMMTTPTKGGNQEVICIPLGHLNGWLFSIEVNRVKPEIREKLIQYQMECYDVLYQHFMPQVAQQYPTTINSEQQQRIQQAVVELYRATGEHYGRIYSRLHVRFKIPKYQDLPASRFEEAMRFLESGVQLTHNHEINDRTLVAIEQVCLHFRIIHGWWKQYEPAISQLNPNIAACLEGSFQQGHVFSHDLERIFNLGLKPLNYYRWYPFGHDREARRLYEMDTPSKGVMLCDLSQ